MRDGVVKVGTVAATLGAAVLLGSCVPAGGGPQGGGGFGSGGFGTAPPSPVAAAREIEQYLANGSAFIEYFAPSGIGGYECGYFGGDGSYESFWGDYTSGGYDEFYGGWSVRGDELCINGAWYEYGEPHLGCVPVEWSRDDTLLLLDGWGEVLAELTAYDGPGEYEYGCGL